MESNLKVVHISKFYKPYFGGLESVVADISEGVADSGMDVDVYAIDQDKLCRYETINNVNVIRSRQNMHIMSQPISFMFLLDIIKCNADILHVHLPNPLANLGVFFKYLLSNKKSKLVLHWHSDIIKQKKMLFFYRPLLNWILKKSDKIIVTSNDYLKHSEQLELFNEKCEVIPIGIDTSEQLVNHELVLKIKQKYDNKCIVFSLGRHIYYKGFEYLLNAAKNTEGAVFLIGGAGPDTNKYKKIVDDNNLNDKVFFVGRIPDYELPSYFFASDIFCFPSIEKSEAFGVVQLEAMCLGTPVISTAIVGSGVSWVNMNNHSGLICNPKSSEDLEDKLKILISNNDLRRKLGLGAKSRYKELFKKEKMIDSILKLYFSLI